MVDEENFDKISFCESYLLNAESTAIGSNSQNTSNNLNSIDITDLIFREEDFEDGGKSNTISIGKLIKMDPIYQLFNAYFVNADCKSYVEALENDYEFQVLSILFTYLKLTFKSSGNLTLKQKLILLLKSQPSRPKKKQKLLQTIFTQIHKSLQFAFDKGLDCGLTEAERRHKFNLHYFSEIAKNVNSIDKDFDASSNCKNRNLPYEFMEKLFKSKNFAEDFVENLRNEYLVNYRVVRLRKLTLVFSKFERFFLESHKESEAIDKMKSEVTGSRFKLPWTDSELSQYFQYFYDLQKKSASA